MAKKNQVGKNFTQLESEQLSALLSSCAIRMSILDDACVRRVTAGATVGAAVGAAVGAPRSSAFGALSRARRRCVRHIRGCAVPGAARQPRWRLPTHGSHPRTLCCAGAWLAQDPVHREDHHVQRCNFWLVSCCRQPLAGRAEKVTRRSASVTPLLPGGVLCGVQTCGVQKDKLEETRFACVPGHRLAGQTDEHTPSVLR